jgi:hypothetical protein
MSLMMMFDNQIARTMTQSKAPETEHEVATFFCATAASSELFSSSCKLLVGILTLLAQMGALTEH